MLFEPNIEKPLRDSQPDTPSMCAGDFYPCVSWPFFLCNGYVITNVATLKQYHKNWVITGSIWKMENF